MSGFDDSRWANADFSREYRDSADHYIPERHKMIGVVKSLYTHFRKQNPANKVLDLGCGDGFVVHELFKIDKRIEATLLDGSSKMLGVAKKRFSDFKKVCFVHASFQDLSAEDPLKIPFDFILSSFAIHHLKMREKEALFEYAYCHLNPGGFFINMDVVLAPNDSLENWYLSLWKQWIEENTIDSKKPSLLPIPKQYKDNADNVPDTLSAQLKALKKVKFKNVDCYYKYGIFTMFGGVK